MVDASYWRSHNARRRSAYRFVTVQLIATVSSALIFSRFGHKGTDLVRDSVLFGIPTAVVLTTVTHVLYPPLRRWAFLPSILARAIMGIASVAVGSILGFCLYAMALLHHGPLHPAVLKEVRDRFLQQETRVVGVFALVSLLVLAAFNGLTRRLGPGMLGNLILGRYHRPRREQRIFMFLDIKDSTHLAESLGEGAYSALIRDFFSDLTPAILDTNASVVQFVGDEVVLTWPMRLGLRRANCIGAYLLAKEIVTRRRPWYLERYGVAPDFKAGLHGGTVISTEVGDVKTDLVFHGDVMNTAARLRSLCSTLGVDLVVSEDIVRKLPPTPVLPFANLGHQHLKGKEREVTAMTLGPAAPSLEAVTV